MDDADARGRHRPVGTARPAARRRSLRGIPRSPCLAVAADRAAADARRLAGLDGGRSGSGSTQVWTSPSRRFPGNRTAGRIDPVPGASAGAREPRDRLDVARAVGLGHGGEHGGEAPAARARLRGARLPESRVQDRRAQRAGAPCARGAPGPSSRGSIASTCWSATARTGTRPGTASSTTTGRPCGRRSGNASADPKGRSSGTSAARSIEIPVGSRHDRIPPTDIVHRSPVSDRNWSSTRMIESVNVIGSGRVGSAVAARLGERGVALDEHRPGPRPSLRAGPRHRRGGGERRTGPVDRPRQRGDAAGCACASRPPLRRASAADVHAPPRPGAARRRVGGGDGARATRRARSALGLAETLGLRPFRPRDDAARALPRGRRDRVELPRHAPARGGLARWRRRARLREALVPLMRRTIENGFELTRADLSAVTGRPSSATSQRSGEREPELEPLYRALAEATAAVA